MNEPSLVEVIYHGYFVPNGKSVIAVETPQGEEIGLVPHLVRHSPTGLSWGYDGSGPADTARSLLLAALGPDGLCPRCHGTGRLLQDPVTGCRLPGPVPYGRRLVPEGRTAEGLAIVRCRRQDCEDGYRRVPYQEFKRDVVIRWDWEWRISRAAVLDWLGSA